MKKSKRLIVMGSAIGLLSVSVFASPILTTIQASLNTSPIYTLNGEKIMENSDAIIYNQKTYVPVEDLAKVLGFTFNNKDNVLSLESITTSTPSVTLSNATIKNVDLKNNQITILPNGQKDSYENTIILNLSNDTTISHETLKRVFTKEDLKEGLAVTVVHSPAMALSLPPQTSAFSITILGTTTTPNIPDSSYAELDDVVIESINHKEKLLTVKNENGKLIQVAFTNKTKITYDDHKKPNAASLKVGQEVDIKLNNGIATTIEIDD